MADIAENLETLKQIKADLKAALISQGQEPTDDFSQYSIKLSNIPNLDITKNATAKAEDILKGKTAYVNSEKIEGIFEGGGIPEGFSAIKKGTFTLERDLASGSTDSYSVIVEHNLGVKPDLIMFYSPVNIEKTYSDLIMIYSDNLPYMVSGVNKYSFAIYHQSSTTALSGGRAQTSYGIQNVNDKTFKLKTQSPSSGYYWRAGTYEWIAIKF